MNYFSNKVQTLQGRCLTTWWDEVYPREFAALTYFSSKCIKHGYKDWLPVLDSVWSGFKPPVPFNQECLDALQRIRKTLGARALSRLMVLQPGDGVSISGASDFLLRFPGTVRRVCSSGSVAYVTEDRILPGNLFEPVQDNFLYKFTRRQDGIFRLCHCGAPRLHFGRSFRKGLLV